MRSGLVCALFAVAAAMSATGCTFLVTFDDHPDASCSGGSCDASVDGTVVQDAGDAIPEDDALPDFDGDTAGDAGDCSILSEGMPCAKESACSGVWTCHKGVCTAAPVEAGTPCGPPMADGGCQRQAVCVGAVCAPAADVDAGTPCGPVPDECHEAPMCANGACAMPANKMDGTKCGGTPSTCHVSATCTGGVCGAETNAANGSSCGSSDDCHDAPTCTNGVCGTAAAKADGTPWGSGGLNMCCKGAAVTANSDSNCGVCGWACIDGTSCNSLDGYYLCTGCLGGGDCPSGCCSETTQNHCSPSDCSTGACKSPTTCTDGSHCVAGSTVDYCTY